MNTEHLTNEEFTELLAGEYANDSATAHLDTCGACREELAAMQTAVGDLRALSLRWAEARAPRITVPSRWTLGWHRLPGMSAAASLLLCGVAIGIHFQTNNVQTSASTSQVQTVTAAPSDDELAQDNRLLQSIDQELNRQVTPQVPASELTVSSRALRHHGLREEAN